MFYHLCETSGGNVTGAAIIFLIFRLSMRMHPDLRPSPYVFLSSAVSAQCAQEGPAISIARCPGDVHRLRMERLYVLHSRHSWMDTVMTYFSLLACSSDDDL